MGLLDRGAEDSMNYQRLGKMIGKIVKAAMATINQKI